MITMVTEERKPLFGQVVGCSEAVDPSAETPHIELSPLGENVAQIWKTLGCYHPDVKVVALQMMPDHLHAIPFVRVKMENPLRKVILGLSRLVIGLLGRGWLLWHSNILSKKAPQGKLAALFI